MNEASRSRDSWLEHVDVGLKAKSTQNALKGILLNLYPKLFVV